MSWATFWTSGLNCWADNGLAHRQPEFITKHFPFNASFLLRSLQWRRHSVFRLRTPQFSLKSNRSGRQALREWQDYEDAVKDKDLARALRFLQDVEPEDSSIGSSGSLGGGGDGGGELELFRLKRDWEVLDTCLNADDMRLVGSAYTFLKDRGFLPNFGKCWSIVLEGPRDVTPSVLKSSTGLEVSKLSPKKWGLSGSSSVLLIALLGGVSFLLNQGIDIGPNLAAMLGLGMMDSIFLGGTCLAQISSYWPPYRRRILVHEAGHLLAAYLMGCPIRGVILDLIVAMQMGIQGQVEWLL
ncbi:uncharacterized protein LOC132301438 [Cornus florida]|uniref:uncharacterized protein LOC132301438 n=1 Tax=Cornus florida TaxID=4283 RepID=UPI0028998803|nr:uncharacterized protein LOC132301438 [Cornus florida]